jgi:hypothetical protein
MIDAAVPVASTTRVATPKARSYLIQLCKHFAHGIPATFAGNQGRIEFNGGVCDLDAEDATALAMTISTVDPAQLSTLEDVVDRHLRRFAFKEELAIQWTRAPGA